MNEKFTRLIFAYVAFFSMNSRRGATSSPISMENDINLTLAALSIVTCFRIRVSGFIVVSTVVRDSSSPKPLYRLCMDSVFLSVTIFLNELPGALLLV